MKQRTIKIAATLVTVLLLGLSVSNAGIVVLDFESLSTPGTGFSYIGPSYTEDGFNLQAVPSGKLYYFNSDDENFAGSTALFHMRLGGEVPDTMLTHADGLPFDLLSIDISEKWLSYLDVGVTLIGTKSDNSTVTSSFALDGVFGFEMHTLETFTDLVALKLTQYSHSYQYDNITLDVIPEPTTILLLGLGGLFLRKRN